MKRTRKGKSWLIRLCAIAWLIAFHGTVSSDPAFTPKHMVHLCSGDYPYSSENNPLADFDDRFLTRVYTVCDLWSVSSAIELPTEIELARGHCDTLTATDEGKAIYEEYYSLGQEQSLQESFLCYLATSDRDRDSIPDFALDECGYFVDNDWDIDNDNKLNWLDFAHDSGMAELGGAGGDCSEHPSSLPAIYDWSVSRIPGATTKLRNSKDCDGSDTVLCSIQRELWEDYQILLYEADTPFTLTLANALSDVLRYVFGAIPKKSASQYGCEKINMIKVISVAQQPVRETASNCEVNTEILAEAKPTTYELVLYPGNIKRPTRLASLVLLVHELGHFYQYSMDFADHSNHRKLMTDEVWLTPVFDRYVQQFGWEFALIDETVNANPDRNISIVNDPILHDRESYTLDSLKLTQLLDLIYIKNAAIDSGPSERHSDAFKQEYTAAIATLSSRDVVGTYALTDPWEWHSDVLAAYVLKSIEDHILTRFEKEHDDDSAQLYANIAERLVNRVRRTLFTIFSEDSDGFFDYRYLSEETKQVFQKPDQIPISLESLDYLSCRYVIENKDEVFNPEVTNYIVEVDDVALDPGSIETLEPLVSGFWKDICQQF